MPLPFEQFQRKGVLGFSPFIFPLSSDSFLQHKISTNHWKLPIDFCYASGNSSFPEPTSVLDDIRSSSPLASSSTTTLYSSHGGSSAPGDVTGVVSGTGEKCGQMGLEDLGVMLSGCSPGQEQSILRHIMGDVEDPGFGFGYGYGFEAAGDISNPLCSSGLPTQIGFNEQPVEFSEEKLQIWNYGALINASPAIFPSTTNPLSSPPAKRFNSGQPAFRPDFNQHQKCLPSTVPGHDLFLSRGERTQLLPQHGQPVATPARTAGNSQSAMIDQLFTAAELIGIGGDLVLAQGILARLNQHLNAIGDKPAFQKAVYYVAEALQSLILSNSALSAQTLVLRIAAYMSFTETSTFLQFSNFTANQAIFESFEGFDRLHIIDFDVGYGGQWASLMQELASRNGATPPLRITVFASPSTIADEFELRFTEENLKSFAGKIEVPFEIEVLSLELLLNPAYWPLSLRSSENEAIAVKLPIGAVVSGHLPLILRYIKQMSPNVVVCSDRGCDRNDSAFPNAVIHALQYYTSLLESLDAASLNADAQANIERFWLQPSIEKLLRNRHRWMERSPPWRSLLTQCGFWAGSLSNKAEAQAEYLVQRSFAKGFHVEKRQSSSSSLVLCWQRQELVSVSVWRC